MQHHVQDGARRAVVGLAILVAVVLAAAFFAWRPRPLVPGGVDETHRPVQGDSADGAAPSIARELVVSDGQAGSLTLVRAETREPISLTDCKVTSMGRVSAARTDAEGRLSLPQELRAMPLVIAPDGYYAAAVEDSKDIVEFNKRIVVRGFVQLDAAIAYTEYMAVLPYAKRMGPTGEVGYAAIAVRPDLTFEFTPAVLEEHVLSLVGAVGGGRPQLGSVVWRPGDASVTIALQSKHPTGPISVTVALDVPPTLAEAVREHRNEVVSSGYTPSRNHGLVSVAVITNGRRITLGDAELGEDHLEVTGDAPGAGLYLVEVMVAGLGVHRQFGPFMLDAQGARVVCRLESGARAEVLVGGFTKSNLVTNPVTCLVTDDRGELVASAYVRDGAERQGTAWVTFLPAGKIAFWGVAPNMASRPEVRSLGALTSERVSLTLLSAVRVRIDGSGQENAIVRLEIVDPVTGARNRVPLDERGIAVIQVAPGTWSLSGVRENAAVISAAFEALGDEVVVQVPE